LGLLTVDVEGHGGLRLGPESRPVLRGERTVALRRDPRGRAATKGAKKRAERKGFDDPADDTLFEALRARRLALAKEQGVPPYVIFHDTTLDAMARAKPQQLHQMAEISGIGQVKLDRYGEIFLEVVRAHQSD